MPTGDSGRGLGNGQTQIFLPIWFQKSVGEKDHQWTTYGGGGFWINPGEDHRDFWRVGWEVQHELGERLTLGAEVYHETPAMRGESGHTAFNVGGFVNFDEHNHLLLSVGRDISGPDKLSFYVGVLFTP